MPSIYNYHPATCEYLGEAVADESPLEPGVYLIPADATLLKPPAAGHNKKAVFDGQAWTVVPDHRGQVYWQHGAQFKIELLGESPPIGSTPDKPAPTLTDLKAAKNADINAARLAANRQAFEHAGKQFACDELSRSDIDGTNGYVAIHGALPEGWLGAWKAVDNNYLPIADVNAWKDFYSSMVAQGNANFAHAQALKAALEAATTVEQVKAIVW